MRSRFYRRRQTRKTRACKIFGRVYWPPLWTRTDGTPCANLSLGRSSKWIHWMPSFSQRSAIIVAKLGIRMVVTLLARKLNCSTDEVLVSFNHLAELDCVSFMDSTGPRIQPYMKPFGTLLMNVVEDAEVRPNI